MADYIYGNSVYPEIPERNELVYPHAMIVTFDSGEVHFYYSDLPLAFIDEGLLIPYFESADGAIVYRHKLEGQDKNKYWGDAVKMDEYIHLYYSPEGNTHGFSVDFVVKLDWHTGLYNYDGELVLQPSPAPRRAFCLVSWLTAIALRMMEKPSTKIPKYDTRWPIEFSYPAVVNNQNITAVDKPNIILVSPLTVNREDYEKLVWDVTENGVTTTQRYEGIFLQENDVDFLLKGPYIVRKAGTAINVTFPQTGIYWSYGGTTPRKYCLRKED